MVPPEAVGSPTFAGGLPAQPINPSTTKTRQIEPNSEGSDEKSQDCRDKVMYGHFAGFSCNRRPFEGLVSVCPWMARD